MDQLKSANTSKILHTLKKIQFVSEFIIISKFGEKSAVLPEFLMAIQAFKFYFKTASFAEQENLYLQNNQPQEAEPQESQPKDQIKKMAGLLDKIRSRQYQNKKFQEQMYEQLPCGKKIQMINTKEVPEALKRTKLNFQQIIGEVLTLLRPLISIIAIRIFGQDNFKAYLLSLAIDLFIVFILQRGIKVANSVEAKQLQDRRKDIVYRYIFRRPFYYILKSKLIQPMLKLVMKQDRVFYRLLISLFDMQSTITLTL